MSAQVNTIVPYQQTPTIHIGRAISSGLRVAISAVIVGANPATALVLGSVYATVDQVTRPFFRSRSPLVALFFNTAATTGLVNTFSKVPFRVGEVFFNVAAIPFLSAVMIGIITGIISLAMAAISLTFSA